MKLKLMHIVGARPQFVKSGAISRVIKNDVRFKGINELYVHTGQHYDKNMSENFFKELEIPEPDYNLGVGTESHGKQTALMLERIEKVLSKESPDWILVYGDTNSTLAGSLAASKLPIKVGHVEAGLRSYNRRMPEEINRIVADAISDVLFAPTENAMNILRKEGQAERSVFVGDVMYDSILFYKDIAEQKIPLSFRKRFKDFYLATIHRPENTDDSHKLQNIFTAFSKLDAPVVIPLHPRTKKIISKIRYDERVRIIDPVGYLELIYLIKTCKRVLTDSGGIQKEAYFLDKPCLTLRNETEWIETLENNWNFLVGDDIDMILDKVKYTSFGSKGSYFGGGDSSVKILEHLFELG